MVLVQQLVLRLMVPLDAARGMVLQQTGRTLAPLLRQRSLRVGVLGALSVVVALALVCAAPLLVLTVTPLLLGVPHLLSDLRYLVVRQQLHERRLLVALVVPCLALAVLEAQLSWGLCAVMVTVLLARASVTSRALALAVCLAAGLLAHQLGPKAAITFAHVHNLIALAVWVLWSRERRVAAPALVLFLAATVMLFSGALDSFVLRPAALSSGPWALDPNSFVQTLSLSDHPIWAIRFVSFFALAQSIHYGVWLKLIPEDDRTRVGIRSFHASYHALARDLGPWLPIAALLLTLGFCTCACWGVGVARDAYFRLALFHGPLEVAVLTLLALERRALRREDSVSAD